MGSGKSLLSSFFKKKGVPVYYSDKKGKILMNKIRIIKENIIKFFGKDSYKKNIINKTYLSQIVFKNPIALKLLCSIVHPWISIDFKKWMLSITKVNKTIYAIKESALLFETKSYKKCDFIITTISTKENMIERIMKRDNLNENQIIDRLKNQISNKKRKKKSDFIIRNDFSIQNFQNESDIIFKHLKKLIKK